LHDALPLLRALLPQPGSDDAVSNVPVCPILEDIVATPPPDNLSLDAL
jgi:hypothetical protein